MTKADAPHRSRIVVGLIVLVLAGAVGWALTRPIGSVAGPPADASSGAARKVGTDVGDEAPAFTGEDAAALVDLDGTPVTTADLAGHPTWIVFWATWCTPCREEAADIVAEYEAHRSDGLQVIAIDVQEPAVSVRQFVAAHGITYRVVLDPTAAAQLRYGGWGLPLHFFLDADGTIRSRYIGQLTRSGMDDNLRSILGS